MDIFNAHSTMLLLIAKYLFDFNNLFNNFNHFYLHVSKQICYALYDTVNMM